MCPVAHTQYKINTFRHMKGELKIRDEIIGRRIGIFDVIRESDHRARDGHKLYHVKCCECGWESDLRKIQIEATTKCTHLYISGNLRSFNTYTWENQRIRSIFSGMKSRCYDPDDKNYQWYGAKGIEICDEWLRNPKLFEKWALENGYDDNLTIDRENENKDYCPENCRWITSNDNARYKSTTRIIDVDGESHTGREWADVLKIGTNVVNTYIRKYGEENTKEFIKRFLENPGEKPKKKSQSYYDLYMNQSDISC